MKTLLLTLLLSLSSSVFAEVTTIRKMKVSYPDKVICNENPYMNVKIQQGDESFVYNARTVNFKSIEICEEYDLYIRSFGFDLRNGRYGVNGEGKFINVLYVNRAKEVIGFENPDNNSIILLDLEEKQN